MRDASSHRTARPASRSLPGRYLALVFPWLPIERLRSARPHLFAGRAEAPAALVETTGNTARLAALDRLATALGLRPGMTLAEARAQLPELETFPHDPGADCDWLDRLAASCQRYTAVVAPQPPDALLLDITGCTHAFDGERPLAADVERRFARRGVLVRHAFGDSAEIALALARYAGAPAPDERGAVRRLPVTALELGAEDAAALSRAGLKTVGEVMARPLATVAAHFGEAAATAVRRLAGVTAGAPLVPCRAEAPIVVERRFAEPVARSELALVAIGGLAAEAVTLLERRHEGGRRWQVRLFRADGELHVLRVETERPTRDASLLSRLVRERLDALADPPDPGSGYDLIRLDVVLAERLDAAQLRLEGGEARAPAATDQVAELVDRPSARLGRSRVRRFAARDSHSTQQAELMLPAAAPSPTTTTTWPVTETGESPLRPIYLFDPPQPIEHVVAEVPDGPPARFRWRRCLHEVARAEGPERIAGEWWRRHEGAVPARDYYRIEDRRGRRFWIFRQGMFGEIDQPRWYIHGLFA